MFLRNSDQIAGGGMEWVAGTGYFPAVFISYIYVIQKSVIFSYVAIATLSVTTVFVAGRLFLIRFRRFVI